MMMEDLLILLPTPMMLPPIIVGVSPEGITGEFPEASPWSALTGFPVVAEGFAPEVDPAGCVPVWPGCTPHSMHSRECRLRQPAEAGDSGVVSGFQSTGLPAPHR